MRLIHLSIGVLFTGLAAGPLSAQQGTASAGGQAGGAQAAQAAASAPSRGGPPAGMGRHHPGGQAGADVTPGWSLMTPQEREEHRERMRSMQSHEECQAAMEQHRTRMAERARERGAKPPAMLRRDACARLRR
jgi:hypothetical protein